MRRFLTARWEQLLFVNYDIDPALLQSYLPRGLELDAWQGRHFVSIVAFQFRDTRLLGIPVPTYRNFEEVNLRFYVRREEGNEIRRGVVFIKEVVSLCAVAWVGRWAYNENYVTYPTSCLSVRPTDGRKCRIEYRWGELSTGAEYDGEPRSTDPGSHEEFITEHYWGYTRQRDGSTIAYKVEHPKWRVWQPARCWLSGDAESLYGKEFASVIRQSPASSFVADGSPIVVYRGQPLTNGDA